MVLLLGCILNAQGAFFRPDTHWDMFRQVSVYGILACGMCLVITTAGIDLSVGSVLGLTGVLFSMLTIHQGWSALGAVAVCLLAGTALGAVSGTIIARFKVQPFIATLAMMVFARGLAKWVSGGQKISQAVQLPDGTFIYKEIPAVFNLLDQKILGGHLAVVALIFAVCAAVAWVVLSKLTWGRYMLAIGGNEATTRLSGVPVAVTKILAYALCGLLAAVAGICQAAQEQQGDPEAGMGYELNAIAMVVIGGTALSGGKGGIGPTLLGILTIGYLEKILSLNAVGESTRLMLTGGIIIAAVLLQKSERA